MIHLRPIALAAMLASCGGGVMSTASTKISAPPDVRLDRACVPSGPERCFDATDNNCNGAIDEGCGVRTGIVQFSIAWEVPDADVDLIVTDPRGQVAGLRQATKLGLVKDRDCPTEECHDQNTENVFLEGDSVPKGQFRVVIRLNRLGADKGPVNVRLGVRVGQQSYGARMVLEAEGDKRMVVFSQ